MKANRRFVKQGDKLVIKQDIKPEELSPKQILENIQFAENNIDKGNAQLKQLEQQKKQLIDNIEMVKESHKELKKHEVWASEIQLSKLKSLIPEAISEAVSKVLSDYKWDEFITDEQNVLQMERQVQAYVGRNKKISEEVSNIIITKHVYESSILAKQWENKPFNEVKQLLK